VRNFFKKLKTQPLLFLDVLFWKNRNDCHLITVEYKTHSLRKMGNKNGKRMKTSISDALGDDEAAAPRSLADALGDDEAGDEPWSTIDKIDHG
jgi:timeless